MTDLLPDWLFQNAETLPQYQSVLSLHRYHISQSELWDIELRVNIGNLGSLRQWNLRYYVIISQREDYILLLSCIIRHCCTDPWDVIMQSNEKLLTYYLKCMGYCLRALPYTDSSQTSKILSHRFTMSSGLLSQSRIYYLSHWLIIVKFKILYHTLR